MFPIMRFYVLPKEEDKTTYINFDHVSNIRVVGKTIELYFVGIEAPLVLPKTVQTLNTVGKGMDLSDASKEHLNSL